MEKKTQKLQTEWKPNFSLKFFNKKHFQKTALRMSLNHELQVLDIFPNVVLESAETSYKPK